MSVLGNSSRIAGYQKLPGKEKERSRSLSLSGCSAAASSLPYIGEATGNIDDWPVSAYQVIHDQSDNPGTETRGYNVPLLSESNQSQSDSRRKPSAFQRAIRRLRSASVGDLSSASVARKRSSKSLDQIPSQHLRDLVDKETDLQAKSYREIFCDRRVGDEDGFTDGEISDEDTSLSSPKPICILDSSFTMHVPFGEHYLDPNEIASTSSSKNKRAKRSRLKRNKEEELGGIEMADLSERQSVISDPLRDQFDSQPIPYLPGSPEFKSFRPPLPPSRNEEPASLEDALVSSPSLVERVYDIDSSFTFVEQPFALGEQLVSDSLRNSSLVIPYNLNYQSEEGVLQLNSASFGQSLAPVGQLGSVTANERSSKFLSLLNDAMVSQSLEVVPFHSVSAGPFHRVLRQFKSFRPPLPPSRNEELSAILEDALVSSPSQVKPGNDVCSQVTFVQEPFDRSGILGNGSFGISSDLIYLSEEAVLHRNRISLDQSLSPVGQLGSVTANERPSTFLSLLADDTPTQDDRFLSTKVSFPLSSTASHLNSHVMPGITQGISSHEQVDPSDVFLEFPSQEESVDNAGVSYSFSEQSLEGMGNSHSRSSLDFLTPSESETGIAFTGSQNLDPFDGRVSPVSVIDPSQEHFSLGVERLDHSDTNRVKMNFCSIGIIDKNLRALLDDPINNYDKFTCFVSSLDDGIPEKSFLNDFVLMYQPEFQQIRNQDTSTEEAKQHVEKAICFIQDVFTLTYSKDVSVKKEVYAVAYNLFAIKSEFSGNEFDEQVLVRLEKLFKLFEDKLKQMSTFKQDIYKKIVVFLELDPQKHKQLFNTMSISCD